MKDHIASGEKTLDIQLTLQDCTNEQTTLQEDCARSMIMHYHPAAITLNIPLRSSITNYSSITELPLTSVLLNKDTILIQDNKLTRATGREKYRYSDYSIQQTLRGTINESSFHWVRGLLNRGLVYKGLCPLSK